MPKIDLKKIKKAYFIGIGGIGMSAVARMFLLEGRAVSGSDISDSTLIHELQKLGAHIYIGEQEKLPADTDLVIYTVAISEFNPIFKEAQSRKIPTLSYPETLGLISKDKFTIAVAGTHGKTTTTAMIAQILIEAGLDPTVIVGSLLRGHQGQAENPRNFSSNFVAGHGKYFVVEACEYKRSFLNLEPSIAVITNIDDDHLDYYGDFAGVQAGFREFANKVKRTGALVTDARNPKIAPVLAGLKPSVVDYESPATGKSPKIILKIPGKHNIQNAKAALAVAKIVGVPEEKALKALANFSGTWRRFEEKGQTKAGAKIYDDYAHHPSEIKATLEAAREKFPAPAKGDKVSNGFKLIVAFQPHLYSRTKEHLGEFAEAFAEADEILLLPIYAAREPKDPEISSEILAQKMVAAGRNARFFADFDLAAQYLNKNLKAGDVLFTMGAGDINKLGEKLLS